MSEAAPTHSRFGGLWTDRLDARDELRRRVGDGRVPAELEDVLAAWIRDGFAILPGAVDPARCDAVLDDVERAWRGEFPQVWCEHFTGGKVQLERPRPELRSGPHKLQNLHSAAQGVVAASFAPAIREFLGAVFDDEPLAFTTLFFDRGTKQPIHQDTAFVEVAETPLELAASWIALEDVREGSGELEYFPGSHRIEELVFEGGRKSMPPELFDDARYSYELYERCKAKGLELVRFLPKRGDALIWAADLVHGGRMDSEPEGSRRSLVTHYCPRRRDPGYFGYWEHSEKVDVPGGGARCWYLR